MSKNRELLDARLGKLVDELERLIVRRTRALDAAGYACRSDGEVQAAERELTMGEPPESENESGLTLDGLKRSMDQYLNGRRSAAADAAFRKRMHAALDRVMGRDTRARAAGSKRARAADSAQGSARVTGNADRADQIMRRRRAELRGD